MKFFNRLLIGILALFLTCSVFAGSYGRKQTITQIAASNPNFTTLVTALKKAHLAQVLEGKGPFTVFAPTNKAFDALPKGTLKKLLNNPKQLKKVLLYHVVSGDIKSNMIKPGKVRTVEGQKITLSINSHSEVMVNNATVTSADIDASNGVIHVINKVLIPPRL